MPQAKRLCTGVCRASTTLSPARPKVAFQDLPLDVLPPILEKLSDRTDWHACALVSKVFNRAATPLLYRTLDSRIISKTLVHHPSSTLIRRPDLAQYVHHVTETGSIHRGLLPRYPTITEDTLHALSLCTSLRSITWIDDSSTATPTLLSFLSIIRNLPQPLHELTIRTHSDLGEQVWEQITTLAGLRKVSIWCMEGPPRVLQGWSERLGSTLTHLELGRCAGVPPTILTTVLAHLPRLQDLRLKGAPASAIPNIIAVLPDLRTLDTEYLLTGSSRRPASSPTSPSSPQHPSIRTLTIRTSSIDTLGPQKLWSWIRDLVPGPRAALETFRLHAFTISMGYVEMPRIFILDLARIHGATLKHFIVGDVQLTLGDIECLCGMFPALEVIGCSTNVGWGNVVAIKNAIAGAKNLRTLTLRIQWIPSEDEHDGLKTLPFSIEDAKHLMLRDENSKLRLIGVGPVQFTGKWILEDQDNHAEKGRAAIEVEEGTEGEKVHENPSPSRLRFVVTIDVAQDRWHM